MLKVVNFVVLPSSSLEVKKKGRRRSCVHNTIRKVAGRVVIYILYPFQRCLLLAPTISSPPADGVNNVAFPVATKCVAFSLSFFLLLFSLHFPTKLFCQMG